MSELPSTGTGGGGGAGLSVGTGGGEIGESNNIIKIEMSNKYKQH
jgi:hypothetical protein